MLELAHLRKCRYWPEMLPHTAIRDIAADSTANLLDLRRFNPLMLTLASYGLPRNNEFDLRVRADAFRAEHTLGAIPSAASHVPVAYSSFDRLIVDLYSSALNNETPTFMSLWVTDPNVAQKIKHGLRLTEEEKEIADRLNIHASVEKGVLPLPIDYMIGREYQVVNEVVEQRTIDLPDPGTRATIDEITPPKGHCIILKEFSSTATTVANNLRITVDRDHDESLIENMRMHPHAVEKWQGAQCFIPAMRQLRLEAVAAEAITPTIRYRYAVVKLTNTLRARFGLLDRHEAPGDVWWKVKGGVL